MFILIEIYVSCHYTKYILILIVSYSIICIYVLNVEHLSSLLCRYLANNFFSLAKSVFIKCIC